MLRRAFHGLIAGAAGSATLNIITYLDMLGRARPSSSVPADTAQAIAETAGVELSADDESSTQARRTAAGSLMGYGAGLGVGTLYGVVEDAVPDLPLPIAGAMLGAAAMLASDVPATVTGSTDPGDWTPQSWMADIVPHLGYGLATVAVYRTLRG